MKSLPKVVILTLCLVAHTISYPWCFDSGQVLAEPSSIQAAPSGGILQFLSQAKKKLSKSLQIGLSVVDAETGKPIVGLHAEQQMTPASVVKLVTSTASLYYLGASYRFPTEVFSDRSARTAAQGIVGNLYVRGYGDPSLTDERMALLAREIFERGVRVVDDIVVDESLFVDPPQRSGPSPYQAGLGALSTNHNCYRLLVRPGALNTPPELRVTSGFPVSISNKLRMTSGARARVIANLAVPTSLRLPSAEGGVELSGTPLPLSVEGTLGQSAGPQTYYQTVFDAAHYFASTLRFHLEREGVRVRGKLFSRETPRAVTPVLTFYSEDLGLILRSLNKYSNNFTAGQLVYALGQGEDGRFYFDLGMQRLTEFMVTLGVNPSEFHLVDGSGLSRENKLSAEHLVRVLSFAYRNLAIAPDLLASLSRFGQSGTLKKRNLKGAPISRGPSGGFQVKVNDLVWAKTGTLTRVSSLAGVLETRSGRRIAFAILVNGNRSKSRAMQLENEVVRRLVETQ